MTQIDIGDYVDPQTLGGGTVIPGEPSGSHGWERMSPLPQGYQRIQMPNGEIVVLDENNFVVGYE